MSVLSVGLGLSVEWLNVGVAFGCICFCSVSRSVSQSICQSVGLSVCRFLGRSVRRSVRQSVSRFVGLLVCRFVGLSVCRLLGFRSFALSVNQCVKP